MNRLPLIIGAAAVVLAGGYFGLSAYSSSQAEQMLEDWAYETELDEYLRWDSVSSSPLGGQVTVSGIELDMGGSEPTLRAEELVISERIIEEDHTRLRLHLKGVEADAATLGNLRQFSGMAGGMGRSLARASHGFEPALNSGLVELKPFDFELFVDLDDDAGTLDMEFATRIPELIDTHLSYQLTNLRQLNRRLQRLSDLAGDEQALNRFMREELPELAESLERAELGRIRLKIEDRGMTERSIALYQRYNSPLDPTAGSADKQRAEHYEQLVEQTQEECSRNIRDLPDSLEDSCELLSEVMLGKVDGLIFSLEPEERVRLTDLASLDGSSRNKRLFERLNPQVESL